MSETEIHISQILPGSANQLIGSNAAATINEYKTLSGTLNQVNVTNGVGSYTLSLPQSIATTSTPTFASGTLTATTNQLTLGTTNTTTLSATAPSASRIYTIPDAGRTANMVLDQGNYTIGGIWNFSNNITLAASKSLVLTDNSTNTVTIKATNSTTSWTLSLPTTHGSNTNVLSTDGSGNTSWVAASSSGTVNSGTATHLSYYATSTNAVSDASSATISGTYTFSGGAGALTLSSSTIAMGSNKITGLANGTASSDAAAFGQIAANGTVNSGIQYQFGYYATSTNAISGQNLLTIDVNNNIVIPGTNNYYFTQSSTSLVTELNRNPTTGTIPNASNSTAGWSINCPASAANVQIYTSAAINTAASVVATFQNASAGGIQLTGTSAGDNAAAGIVGEYISASANNVTNTASTGSPMIITSISLTAGDWDVSGGVRCRAGSSTSTTYTGACEAYVGVSSSASDGQDGINLATFAFIASVASFGSATPTTRISLSTTTTVYCLGVATFTGTANQFSGGLQARRVR